MNVKNKPRQGNTSEAKTTSIISRPYGESHPLGNCERHTTIDQLIKTTGGQLMRASDLKPGNSSNGGQ